MHAIAQRFRAGWSTHKQGLRVHHCGAEATTQMAAIVAVGGPTSGGYGIPWKRSAIADSLPSRNVRSRRQVPDDVCLSATLILDRRPVRTCVASAMLPRGPGNRD